MKIKIKLHIHVYINLSMGYSSILFSESVGKLIRIDVNMNGAKASIVKEKNLQEGKEDLRMGQRFITCHIHQKLYFKSNHIRFYVRYFLGSCYYQHL